MQFAYCMFCADPTVEISTNAVEIEAGQPLLSLSCSPSSPYLPVTWREGNRSLRSNDSGLLLSPPSLHHYLSIDLDYHILTGQNIVCEVNDPEELSNIVASASAEVLLPPGMHTP